MTRSESGARKVLLYELNEVPWEIVDRYVQARPTSRLAALLRSGRCQTTVNRDPNPLQPWRTWPTFHKGIYSDEHNSLDLGQDPATFRGENIWETAEKHGLRIGIFGALQSWPPHQPRHGGFYVPDTFSRTPETHPPSLRRFQEFNLSMTRENKFSSDAPLNPRRLVLTGLDLLTRGFAPWSAYVILRHLALERRDGRYKAGRSILQALPSFDLFWRLHEKTRPQLSIFFTNHVAGMMHRYWGDADPTYGEQQEYEPDDVFKGFVDEAMEIFDHHLKRLMAWVDRNPDAVLIVASSMGQAAIPYRDTNLTYVLQDVDRLAGALGLGPATAGLAMYPRTSLEFADHDAAEAAATALATVMSDAKPMFGDIRVMGRTASFEIRYAVDSEDLPEDVTYGTAGDPSQNRTGRIRDLGVTTAPRLGGGNTAYHIPEGILISYGRDVTPDPARERISVLEAAPTILGWLGLERAEPSAARIGTEDRAPT